MKTRMVLIAAAVLVFACVSFGQQPFSVAFINISHVLSYSTLTGCEDGAPLPDGTVVEIHQDINGNGPDPTDPLAPMGTNPGQVNYNTFTLNAEQFGIPGGFYTDPAFSSVAFIPQPNNWFLVIRCNAGVDPNAWHYVSVVYHFASGGQEVYTDNDWTCIQCVMTVPCNPTPEVDFQRFPVPAYQCADLCGDHTTVIRICQQGAPFLPGLTPIVSVASGCEPVVTHCDRTCPPAQFSYNPNGWVLDPASGCWLNSVTGLTDGCVCISLEGFLAVGFNNDLSAQAMDNSVKLSWSTSSETGLARYDIIRDNAKVGEVAAAGRANSYNYVDRSAVNGTRYTYTLRAVNSDATVTDLASVEATPSFLNAVVTEYALHQNFPNPFNPTTEITFDVVQKNLVTLKVYNAAGQEVGTVANGEFEAGRHIVSFNATNLPSGLYFYTVKIGSDFSATKKMLLVK